MSTAAALVYYRDDCPYCDMAKKLLEEKGIPYTAKHVLNDLTARREFKALFKEGDKITVPQVIIGGRHIGGFTQLKEFLT